MFRELRLRQLFCVLLLVGGVVGGAHPPTCGAQEVFDSAVDRATTFLSTGRRGSFITGYLHFGAAYRGFEYRETRSITNNGFDVPGHFALVYRFKWANDGYTDLGFLCDEQGDIYDLKVMKSNAVLTPPFVLADLSIQLVGQSLVNGFQDKMSAEELRTARSQVAATNSKGLLLLALRLQQRLEN